MFGAAPHVQNTFFSHLAKQSSFQSSFLLIKHLVVIYKRQKNIHSQGQNDINNKAYIQNLCNRANNFTPARLSILSWLLSSPSTITVY